MSLNTRRTFRGREQARRPTAPGKTLQWRIRHHQFRSRRIQVDVIAYALEITTARSVHDQRLVAPREQVAEELVTPVEATRLSAQQPFHPSNQIGLRRLDHPMKMIRHEDIGVNLPARLGANLAQRLNEALAIRIIHEDQFAPVTAIHDVINRTSILDSQLASRDGRVLWPLYVLILRTDPFSPFSTTARRVRTPGEGDPAYITYAPRPAAQGTDGETPSLPDWQASQLRLYDDDYFFLPGNQNREAMRRGDGCRR